jgi:hypothetical protein
MNITLIPVQYKGAKTGASTHAETATRHDAILLFDEAKRRLLDVNHWHKLCGPGSATFQLTDAEGNEIRNRAPEVGDLIRIKLPAPPNAEGKGFDWVRVEEFENTKDLLKDQDIFGFRVRPVRDPSNRAEDAAHFYTSSATSTFLIMRVSSIVTALERGRNEVPNNKPLAILNKIRNLVIAVGAWIGISHSQWGKLVKGIIKGPPQD